MMDSVFEAAKIENLVWLPERGMGYFEAKPNGMYDRAYFDKYVAYAATDLGRKLDAARTALVRRWAPDGDVLDVGVGCGAFMEALTHDRQTGLDGIWGWDESPWSAAWLHERGRLLNPYKEPRLNMHATFWDSLEHLRSPERLLCLMVPGRCAFVSIPVFADQTHVLRSRHFRRDEHYWYFTEEGFVGWMRAHGFEELERNRMESDLGREDIGTFAFRRW